MQPASLAKGQVNTHPQTTLALQVASNTTIPSSRHAMSRNRATTTLLHAVAAAAATLCFACCLRGGAADTVADSCDAIRDFVDAAFCESRLRSVPGAASADRHGHLLMAADLAAASGASARDAAAGMARGGVDDKSVGTDKGAAPAPAPAPAATRDALEACGILYGASSVPALRLMRGYAASSAWGAARALLPLTGQAGIGCDAALQGCPTAKARMAAANREFDQLSTMATALLNKLP